MPAALSLRTEGVDDAERRLFGLAQRFGDLTPLMDRIGLVLETSTIERFDTETSPDGQRWLPSIRARTTGGKTLTNTARLKKSNTHIATSTSVEVGSNVKYAGTMNDGATITAKGGGRLGFKLPGGLGFRSPRSVIIPARPFIGLSADDREEIEAQAVDYVAEMEPEVQP